VPLRVLSNGVQMPAIACGTGGDTNSTAPTTVAAALGAGFTHIDTAADYGDQHGVGLAIKAVPRKSIFLTTKIPGCGVPTQVGVCMSMRCRGVCGSCWLYGCGWR
jgi:2,5-diketo-D-gluconate reductase A